MRDTCQCPDCGTKLDVNGLYGHHLKCGVCHCPIIVFHDTDIVVETPVGTIGISLPKEWKEKP